jgi:hypothetical protein
MPKGGPMYLSSVIDEVLESKKSKLLGRNTHYYVTSVLNRAFKSTEPFKFRYETYEDYGKDDYSVSGLYDMDTDIRYVMLNFPSSYKYFNLDEQRWREFKFSVSQVCQHEAIHQCQWSFREDTDYEKSPLEFRNRDDEPLTEVQEYLSDPDEIEAYAHDIAMEIRFYYPKKNPYEVLKSIGNKKKVWSYVYYKKTFKGEDWSLIKKHLLKKTFRWLSHV